MFINDVGWCYMITIMYLIQRLQLDTRREGLIFFIKHHVNMFKFYTKLVVQCRRIIHFVLVSHRLEMGSDLTFNTEYLNQKYWKQSNNVSVSIV